MKFLSAAIALLISTSLWAQSGASPDLPGGLRIQIGTNSLIDAPTSMNTGFWGSKSFNFHYLYSVPLGDSHWSFNPGFGFGTDKISFDNDVTLIRDIDRTVIVTPLEVSEFGKINKTKLATTFFEVPFELRFHLDKDDFRKSFKVGVGGKIGVLLSSHTKVNFELDGEKSKLKTKDNFELNRIRYGLQANIGIAGINIYYYYGLNDLFKSNRGPEGTTTNQSQVGFSLNVF